MDVTDQDPGTGSLPLIGAVMVIDDHPLFCEALAMTLTGALRVRTVATATCLAEGLRLVEDGLVPEVVLLDLNLPDVAGIDGLIRLKARLPATPVIVVSSLTDSRILRSVMQAGAAGFVPKDSRREVFLRAIRSILSGGSFLPDGFGPVEAEGPTAAGEVVARLADLTPQQGRILQLVCEGKLNKQIAYELSIAETTVKAHITAILRKLGVQSRTQAVLIAQQASFAALLHRPG